MRDQFLNDGIENFDFHLLKSLECQKLSNLIISGKYVPQRPQRILVEKSKGLCRQLVIPTPRDALVLQCLSDALYKQIKDKAPTDRSFFEPKEHRFSTLRSRYGTFASWLNFQRELFKFSKNRSFIVVTDIANYYDSISYIHLRNAISSITDVDECILDMLIYVLSDLLWQPDYTPRIEIGLPQINLDAPRLLAHCFLYELDSYLESQKQYDFARYMDDIDIGTDTKVDAKRALQAIDLVLQARQVRLNSGKTQILSREQALVHFRVIENAELDEFGSEVDRMLKAGEDTSKQQSFVEATLRSKLRKGDFDTGNGEKILKRWLTLASKLNCHISTQNLEKIILMRPNVRENALAYIRSQPLTPSRCRALRNVIASKWLIDHAGLVDIANYLVESRVQYKNGRDQHLNDIIFTFDCNDYFGFYCKIWMQSKYSSIEELLKTIVRHKSTWHSYEQLGRLVGSMRPLFYDSDIEREYIDEVANSVNSGARDTYKFHGRLTTDLHTFDGMFYALVNPNKSRGTWITHPKYLCLLSALRNNAAPNSRRSTLRKNNETALTDAYYKATAKRIGVF